ncbi:hypothetical protein F8388_008797 [Cannabis sativa]|uniref:CCHC-type domain-containing protein n=1 Tax=Cannabis sativa TaxID=3483 RepID=A0A7J6DTE7_CANSA|nr:hypothetical protein F8388_008797 [Cannabis sativa]
MAQGGGLLPSGIVQDALGFYTLPQKEFFKRDYITSSVAPSIWFFPFGFDFYAFSVLSSATNAVLIFWVSVETGFEEGVVLVQMVGSNTQAVEELIEEIENFCFDDFSIQVEPDNDLARDTVARTVVGRFFAKRGVSLGTLRRALSGMWKLTPGWCLQEPSPKTFVCRLNSTKEVKAVLENGPWNPCGGFLLVSALPENGDWKSANMEALDIWVKAHGVPLPFMTEERIANMASRMGTLLQANKVRRNGILAHDYLRFQVRINVKFSILAGVSLTDDRKKKWWCHLKYERLPILCFKCGVIGHDEAVCSGRKRMVSVQDGRSVPLFGPWLRDGSKLENGFALLEVDDIGDIQRLEKEDGPVSGETGVSDGAAGAVSGNYLGAVASPVGVTRVEKLGMEGVVTQNSEQTFSVAYNDYVDLSKFPTKHVMHVANIFKEKLGPIKFGATCGNEEERQSIMASVQKLNKPKLVGPRGIPKPPIFGRSFNSDKLVGSKRKKSLGKSSRRSDFVAESQGVCCIQVIDKTNIPDVSGETSGANQSGGTFTRSSGEDSGKRYQIDMESLRSKEGSFGSILELGNQKEAVGIPIDNSGGVRVGVQPGLVTTSAPAILPVLEKEAESVMFDARAPRECPTLGDMKRMDGVWHRLGFSGATVVGSVGAAGGLCLCWKEGLEIEIVSTSLSTILTRFSRVLHGPVWSCYWVYAPPNRGDRADFWENLSIEVASVVEPWIMMGDLNLILDQNKKFGGNLLSGSESHIFRDFMDSAVVFSDNVNMGIRGEIKGLMGYRDLNREDKFLGNPILLSGSKVRNFGFLVDKMARRIEGWKSRLLSLAGRSTLIQSVDMSVPIYTMSTFLIPKSICVALDKLVRRFWWKGSDDSNRFLALTNWDSICVPKRWGGLGFKKFEDLNFALVAKLGWNLAVESNTLWCQFFKDKYFRRSCSFWSAPNSNLWSYGARSIMATRDFIRDESCFAIGNGDLVDIWHSPWLPGYGWERYVASFNPRICEKGVRVSSLLIPGSGEWNREALESWFFPSMVRDALEVPRLSMMAKDELFWEAAPDGRFTVKRAFLARIRGRGILEPLWRSLWKASGPERIKIFLWRLARDILPFGNRLQRIFGNSSQCVLCNSGEDSASHLIFHCDVAVQVWRSGPWGFCSDSMVFGDNLELVKWLLQPTGTPLGENDLVRFTIYAISLCFVLWRVRNSSFHEGLCPMVSKIQQEISSLVADCSLDRPSSLEMQGSIPAVAEENWRGLWTDVNVFVDAAIREEFGIVAILVLDRSGTVIEAVTAKRKVPTPFVAELEAFFSGCCRILQSGWENVTIFSDCQTLVKSLAAGPSPEWRACGLFDATRNLLARLPHCQYR